MKRERWILHDLTESGPKHVELRPGSMMPGVGDSASPLDARNRSPPPRRLDGLVSPTARLDPARTSTVRGVGGGRTECERLDMPRIALGEGLSPPRPLEVQLALPSHLQGISIDRSDDEVAGVPRSVLAVIDELADETAGFRLPDPIL